MLEEAFALIASFESCHLTAYPDPASPLAVALQKRGLWNKVLRGEPIPSRFDELSGEPWTIGYGETRGVNEWDVWTQEQADSALRASIQYYSKGVLRCCPILMRESENKLIACTSLAYNIGLGAFRASSVCRKTMRGDFSGAAEAFLLWDKAGGKRMKGLRVRREVERAIYIGDISDWKFLSN